MTSRTLPLEILRSDLLEGTEHGFFTRRGGASSGIFAGLNCGPGSSDQTAIVATNRDRVAGAMGVAPASLVTFHQIHSADVATISAPPAERLRADAAVTGTPGVALAMLTADCQPVLLADRDAGVIGAAHAGWRGTLDGVLEATVAAMEALGAARGHIHAVIGPAISQPNYEVGPEFRDRFRDADPDALRFFAAGKDGKFQFDLPGYGLARLRAAGVGGAAWTGHCTYRDAARFYSFRRSVHRGEADYGRLISAIRL